MTMADNENPAASAAKIGETVAAQLASAAGAYGGAFAGTFKALQEYQAKLLHFVQENTAANIQLTQKMMQPRTPSDFVEFMSAHMRERATAIADQAKELAALGQEAAKKAAESFVPPKSS
jgi:hypothetical protein